jgi:hypothetical protein
MDRSVASQTSPHQPNLRTSVGTSKSPDLSSEHTRKPLISNGTKAQTNTDCDVFSHSTRTFSNNNNNIKQLDSELKTNIIIYNDDADVITITCDTITNSSYQTSPLPSPLAPPNPNHFEFADTQIDQLAFDKVNLNDSTMDERRSSNDSTNRPTAHGFVCCPNAIAGVKCNLPTPLPPPPLLQSSNYPTSTKPYLPPHIRIMPKTQSLDLADDGGDYHSALSDEQSPVMMPSKTADMTGNKIPKLQSLDSRPIYPNVPYSPYGSPFGSPRSYRRRTPLRESRRVSIEQTGSFLQLNQYKLLDQIGQVRIELSFFFIIVSLIMIIV